MYKSQTVWVTFSIGSGLEISSVSPVDSAVELCIKPTLLVKLCVIARK
jgi:hypothetical protein